MQECRDIDEDFGVDLDRQLISMQLKLEQMATQLEFNKTVDNALIEHAPPVYNQSFTLNYK